MKSLILTSLVLIPVFGLLGQVSGNINYQNKNSDYSNYQNNIKFPDNNISVSIPSNDAFYIRVKGMANVKADSYVAIFNITQVAKTAEEVNQLIDNRISESVKEIRLMKGTETYVDMISFVPQYEFEVEKKTFSKKTYNEIPMGFEIKKNLHVKYSDPNMLNEFITLLAKNEIYNLVRVDYFASNLETIKKELMNKAKVILKEKTTFYEAILGKSFVNDEKKMGDAFKMVLPTEMYRSFEAYSNSSIDVKSNANVTRATKSSTGYYQPILDKEFDFVINPVIVEPVIQVMYEIDLMIIPSKKPAESMSREYVMVAPNGELKTLDIKK